MNQESEGLCFINLKKKLLEINSFKKVGILNSNGFYPPPPPPPALSPRPLPFPPDPPPNQDLFPVLGKIALMRWPWIRSKRNNKSLKKSNVR